MRKVIIRQIARVLVEGFILDMVGLSGFQELWEEMNGTERAAIREKCVNRVSETLEPILTDMIHHSEDGKEDK